MVSESPPSMDGIAADVSIEKPVSGFGGKKSRGKAPKKIHKAEREKLKRDHLNELFIELSHALDHVGQNNGKASILSDATRLLRELIAHVGSLKKENDALLNESHYITAEKNELQDDNAALQADIARFQHEIQTSMNHNPPEPDLSPPCNSSLPPVFIVPFAGNLPEAMTNVAVLPSPVNPSSHISRPHARYPTPLDSWVLDFLQKNGSSEQLS